MAEFRKAEELVPIVEAWMKDRIENSQADGIIVGISGGLDSAVVAALGKRAFGDNILGLFMPMWSDPKDYDDALLIANTFGVRTEIVSEETAAEEMICSLYDQFNLSEMAEANIKARLRMVTLYAVAQTKNLLVCGTGNKSEWETGYFTKFGDSASDLLPLADIYKTEVRDMAKFLGVPERIITKAPSAGLWDNQTDEDEMGFTYDQLDHYLLTGEAEGEIKAKIEALRQKSHHKRTPVPICLIPR